jgi:hypothetical protein
VYVPSKPLPTDPSAGSGRGEKPEEVGMVSGRGFLSLVGVWATVSGAGQLMGGGVQAGGAEQLPPPAVAAVRRLFPAASVTGVGQEREQGVLYYEVVLREGNARIEVEVSPDGGVGEVERVVALAAVPQVVRDGISRRIGGAPVREVELHEVRGVPRGGVFVPLDPPRTVYEVACDLDGVRTELAFRADGTPLSEEDDRDADADDDDDDGDDD